MPLFKESKGRPRVLSTVERQSSIERPDEDENVETEIGHEINEVISKQEHIESEDERLIEAVEPPPLQGKDLNPLLDLWIVYEVASVTCPYVSKNLT